MFNLFKNNTTEDFAQFSNEEIKEITKEEAKRAPKSGVVPIKIEAQPPFLYPPFTQEEVDSFSKKVKLVTLNDVAPTPYSVLNKDIPAVKFLGWAEVSTKDDKQLGYTLDKNGMAENVRKNGTKTDDVNGFADCYLNNSFSFAMEQPWAIFTKEECEPYLFVSPNGEMSVKTTRLQQYAGKTRRAGNEQANYLYSKNPEDFVRAEVINGEIKFFVSVVSFHKAGGKRAAYWKQTAWNVENSPNRKTAVKFIKNYNKPEDDILTIYKLCKFENIDIEDKSEQNIKFINDVLRDQLIPVDKFGFYRFKLRELGGFERVTTNYTVEKKEEFCTDRNVHLVNMKVINNTLAKTSIQSRVTPYLKDIKGNSTNGTVYLPWRFKGSGSTTKGVKDGDYDRRCFEACIQLLSFKGVNKVIVVSDCLQNSADHILDIRDYKKNKMIRDQVQLMLSALKTLNTKPQQFDELTHFDYSKIEFMFLPQVSENDDSNLFC